MTVIWIIVYLFAGAPNLFNDTSNDTGWLLVLVLCLILDFVGRDTF